jgi:AcrR family transcriptional regulator
MPRTAQQFEEIRKDRKQSIMDTALKEFATYGYKSTSISMIAKKAEVSKGLMYNYFKSKEELLTSIMSEGFDDMLSLLNPDNDGVLSKEEFSFFIDETFKLMKERKSFYKLYFSLIMQPAVTLLFTEKLNQIIEPLLNFMVDYFTRKGSENPLVEALTVGALLDGIGLNYAINVDQYPLDEVVDMVKEKFL